MRLGIMQPYFFPYIGYFQLIDAVDTFIIYDHVTFRKKSWITRNRILDKGSNLPIYINVPVKGQSSEKLISEVLIDDTSKWKKKFLNLVYFNYKKASFFKEIYPFIERLMLKEKNTVHIYNSYLIQEICELLEIKTQIVYKDLEFEKVEAELKQKRIIRGEVKTERIIKLCQKYKAKTYINPIGGTELYHKIDFEKKGLNLLFTKTDEYSYSQFDKPFTSYLSIIDVLMHTGIKQTKKRIKDYTLI